MQRNALCGAVLLVLCANSELHSGELTSSISQEGQTAKRIMLAFSDWLFPAVFLVFVVCPRLRLFLFPGLVGACAAGAADAIVSGKAVLAWAHGLVAALCVAISRRGGVQGWDGLGTKFSVAGHVEAILAVCAWALAALAVIRVLPFNWWPYSLTQEQMLQLFLMFLPLGAVAAGQR